VGVDDEAEQPPRFDRFGGFSRYSRVVPYSVLQCLSALEPRHQGAVCLSKVLSLWWLAVPTPRIPSAPTKPQLATLTAAHNLKGPDSCLDLARKMGVVTSHGAPGESRPPGKEVRGTCRPTRDEARRPGLTRLSGLPVFLISISISIGSVTPNLSSFEVNQFKQQLDVLAPRCLDYDIHSSNAALEHNIVRVMHQEIISGVG